MASLLPRIKVYELRPTAPGESFSAIHAGEYSASGTWCWKRLPFPGFELYLIAAGQAVFRMPDREYNVAEGHSVLILPDEACTIEKTSRSNMVMRFVHFKLEPQSVARVWPCWNDMLYFLHSFIEKSPQDFGHSIFFPAHLPMKLDPELLKSHTELMRTEKAQSVSFSSILSARFLLLLTDISSRFIAHLRGVSRERVPLASRSALHVARAVNYIDTHIIDPISLTDVAKGLSVNADYLSRLFHEGVGETVGEYILRRKLSIARAKLMTGHMTVKQVAADLGFFDSRYFSRVFRRAEGMTPSEFIKRNSCPQPPR